MNPMFCLVDRYADLINKLSKTATIGIGALAGPGVLFVLPFILPMKQFGVLAAVLATSQLIGVLGAFSLDISCPRLGINPGHSAVYSGGTVFLASAFVLVSFAKPLTFEFVLAILLAWILLLSNIFHSYPLFTGRANVYGAIGFLKAVFFLIVFVVAIYRGVSPEFAWLSAAITGLLTASLLLMLTWQDHGVSKGCQAGLKEVIEFSLPSALIVASGSLPFVIDRVIALTWLSTTDFVRYTICVTWAVPIIYAGNVIEKFMISNGQQESSQTIICWVGGLLVFCISYITVVSLLVKYFVVVPYFTNNNQFLQKWWLIAGWFTIYTAIHNPSFAYIQKHYTAIQLKPLAYKVIGSLAVIFLAWFFVDYCYDLKSFIDNKVNAIILFSVLLATVSMWVKINDVIRHLRR